MSNVPSLTQMLEILKGLPAEKWPAHIDIIKTIYPEFDIANAAKLPNSNDQNQKSAPTNRDRFTYDDPNFDQNRADELTDLFGKHALSNLKNVFIIYCLTNMTTGHKRAEILELLNKAKLPTRSEALNVTLNRLKSKGYLAWNKGDRPQILSVPLEGQRFMETQLANFRPMEQEEFDQAVLLIADRLQK